MKAEVAATGSTEHVGWARRALRRVTWSQDQLDAAELADASRDSGADRIRECETGVPTTVVGRLRSVTIRPDERAPALEAQLYDGTAELTLVFLGRRQIAGITPGRTLAVHGRPIVRDGVRTIFNPRYDLLAAGNE